MSLIYICHGKFHNGIIMAQAVGTKISEIKIMTLNKIKEPYIIAISCRINILYSTDCKTLLHANQGLREVYS